MNSIPTTSFTNLRARIREFIHEREWEKFHSPKNLAMSVAIEAAELMECFQWQSDGRTASQTDIQNAIDELSDVLIYCMALADVLKIDDLEAAVLDKLARSGQKYPVNNFKGKI